VILLGIIVIGQLRAFFMSLLFIVSDAEKIIFKYHHSFSRCRSRSIGEHDELYFSVDEMINEQLKVCFTSNDSKLILGRLTA
jgi:hypothetical protein